MTIFCTMLTDMETRVIKVVKKCTLLRDVVYICGLNGRSRSPTSSQVVLWANVSSSIIGQDRVLIMR